MIRTGLTVLACAFFAVCASAQSQTTAPPNPPTQATADAPQAAPAQPAIPNGPAVNAELNSSVNSKKAKVGDKVEAHTTEPLKNGNDVVVPKGTKLIGHVVEASARSKGDQQSTLAIQFDKAVPKKDQEIPMNLLIIAVAPPAANAYGAAGGSPSSDPMGDRGAAASSSPMGVGKPQQQPQSNGTNYPAASSGGDTSASSGSPSATGLLPANSRGVYGLADFKLMLQNSKPNPGTVITSAGKDVHLDSGTRLLLIAELSASPAPSGR
jgi:hypothetical protein